MAEKLAIMCVHGINHGDADAKLAPSWTKAISDNIRRWKPDAELTFEFLAYDDLFEHAPLNAVTYGEAFASLLASGVGHGIGDALSGTRGLFDLGDQVRWTAGMIAQWASEDSLRAALRKRLLDRMARGDFALVCAHSLGSLICYDAFRRQPDALAGRVLITFGSQIGNAFVRDCFAGRIEPLRARMWYHLYNPDDHVFTAHVRLQAPNFAEVLTEFDQDHDILNHEPVLYLNHAHTRARVWPETTDSVLARTISRSFKLQASLTERPQRRALLIGINDYPDPRNRLEGCVNDVFLISSVLQEAGFAPEEIRVVLNERATTDNLLERLHWLLDDVPSGAQRVLFYSGHGSQIPAYDFAGEVDHLDECLVPYDFDWTPAHAIRDKQFVEFYSQLPYDSHFVAIFDCCHAGGLTRDGGPRVRGIDPPDDIRHRALAWDPALGMWRQRDMPKANRSLSASQAGAAYVGARGDTYRLGRGVSLRGLRDRVYDREREALRHKGSYLPVLMEACQENQLSYEYRDGATSYGAYTYSLAKLLREARAAGSNLTFNRLTQLAAKRLNALGYEQTPCLVGPKRAIGIGIPWSRPRPAATRKAHKTRSSRAPRPARR
jgi:pimeloyl-ACP methyl ester carboxylesterase